jgi:hypothetical protein
MAESRTTVDDEDSAPPPAPGTDEASGKRKRGGTSTKFTGEDGQTQCVSVAWHGERCKNKAKPDMETCAWHKPEFLRRAKEHQHSGPGDPSTDPNKWMVRCTAIVTNKDTGAERQCGKNAVRGLNRCQVHGAAHPAAKEMGERVMKDRVEQHRLQQLITEHGLSEEEALNPLLQLQKLGIETLAVKQYFLEQMAQLEEMVYDDRLGIEQVRAMVQLYERAADRANRLLVDMARLDIDNRLAKISERQGDIIATILEKVLSRMNMPDDNREMAKTYLQEEFNRLAIGA